MKRRRSGLRCCLVAALISLACTSSPRSPSEPTRTAPRPGAGAETPERRGRPTECSVPTGDPDLIPSNTMVVLMVDFEFSPDPVAVPQCVSIEFTNRGTQRHNFSIEDTSVVGDVSVDGRRETGPLGLGAGTYTLFCKYHRDAGMTTTLTIDDF